MAGYTPPSSLKVIGVLNELEMTTNRIRQLEAETYQARVRRDELVGLASDEDVPGRMIQKITGLSRAAITKIKDAPRQTKVY